MIQDWSNRTILIAEDDEISFKYLDLILSRKTNVNILWAINGQMAVEFCHQYYHIDLVLMDIQLPVLDGVEAIRRIKAFRPSLPIIVNTANAFGDEYDRCFEAGCDDFITKPVNLQQLFIKIDHLLAPVMAK
jgi:CheY-like chemotaxis protein